MASSSQQRFGARHSLLFPQRKPLVKIPLCLLSVGPGLEAESDVDLLWQGRSARYLAARWKKLTESWKMAQALKATELPSVAKK
jgi:hypothetical protein